MKGDLIAFAENPSKSETAFTFTLFKDTIVTSVKDTLHIWNLAGKTGALEPIAVKFSDSIVTAVHIDKQFLIVGDNFGGVTLHTPNGKLVYHLNRYEISYAVSLFFKGQTGIRREC